MPIFEIQGSDGRTYEIEAPDAAGAAAGAKRVGIVSESGGPGAFSRNISVPAEDDAPQPSRTADVLKSLGIGVAKGVIGLATLPSNGAELVRAAWNKVAPEKWQAGGEVADANPLHYTATDMQRDVEKETGQFYRPKTVAGEYAQTIGEFAPGLAMPGGLAQRVGLNWLAPAVTSETAGQLTKGTSAEPWARVAGAMLGPAAASLAMRAITPFPTTAERARQAAILEGEGVTLTAGQRTGSRPLRFLEGMASELPISSGRVRDLLERQGEQFTAAALRRTGTTANRATPDVIDQAFLRIGQEFDDLISLNRVRLDQQLANDLGRIRLEYAGNVNPSARAPIIERTIQDINNMRAATPSGIGLMDGELYLSMRSRLTRAVSNSTDPQLQTALRGIRDSLDDAMERGMTAADAARLREARRQYRNLMVIEESAAGAGEQAALGNISPARLRAAATHQSRRDYVRGQGEFDDLARAGNAMMTPLPNSGTPGRLAAQGGLAAVGAVGGAMAGNAPGAAIGAVAGHLAPGVAGRAMLSGPAQAYLGNQMLAPILNEMNPAAATAAQAVNVPRVFVEGQVATNPQTGERVIFKGGQWVPMR